MTTPVFFSVGRVPGELHPFSTARDHTHGNGSVWPTATATCCASIPVSSHALKLPVDTGAANGRCTAIFERAGNTA